MNMFQDEANKTEFCDAFGGEDAEQYNALMTALWVASHGNGNGHVYMFLKKPRTTIITFLVDALNSLGYKIVKQ